MTPALSRRLGEAFGARDLTTGERSAIVAAAQHAERFEDLPPAIQQLVESLERQPSAA